MDFGISFSIFNSDYVSLSKQTLNFKGMMAKAETKSLTILLNATHNAFK